MKYKIAIVDDHPIFRKGLKMVLDTFDEIEVVLEASNGQEFLENIAVKDIDLIFMDVNMPILNGIDTTDNLLTKNSDYKIIAISSFDNLNTVESMIEAGVDGYLLKDADYEEIAKAIKTIMTGGNYYSAKILTSLSQRITNSKRNDSVFDDLTKREKEILNLLCQGMTKKDIANYLSLSERTIEKHKENLFLKTNTNNTVNLVVQAFKLGCVNIQSA